jgi:hypothetical protein
MTYLLNSIEISTYIMYQYIKLVFCTTKSGMLRLQTDLQQLFQGLSRNATKSSHVTLLQPISIKLMGFLLVRHSSISPLNL